jgi:hypothetical protein
MKRPGREVGLAISIGAVVLLGLLIEVAVGDVAPAGAPTVAGPRFEERALFCPPGLLDGKSFAISASTGADVSLGLEPARPDRVELPAGNIFIQQLPGRAPTDVVGYGASVRAGAIVRSQAPVIGEAAARCSDRASSHWFFAAGASTLGVDERILLYNPFPDEAVVRISFLTESGVQTKGNLADVPVPSKSATEIRVNEFIRLERTLGVRIDSKRGRVAAWRMLYDSPEGGPAGVQMSLGATAPSDTWFFPDGGVGDGIDERISLMNPGDDEALVTISLHAAGGEIVQPEDLVQIEVLPGTTRTVVLNDALTQSERKVGGVSAVVQSTNGVGIVAERSIRYNTDAIHGSAAEVGAPRPSEGWFLPAATLNPSTDTVVVMNPGSEPATIDLELLFDHGSALQPGPIQGRQLEPGGRLKIGIGEWTNLETALVRVTSTAPVVAERFSFSEVPNDVGSVLGFPLE